jgi:DNA modification methylase
MREEIIGDCRLLLGDAREILPTLPKFDACVTDPPYGIGASSGTGKYGRIKWDGARDTGWDNAAPSDGTLELVLESAESHIIWGMNYFKLPPTRRYLVWDKGAGFKGRDFAECELAWCSVDGNARVFSRDPLAAGDYKGKEHPTQKPVALLAWCLQQLPTNTRTIVDPFAGSFTTGVACVNRGLSFVGIEREEKYFEVGVRRIQQAQRQPDMFVTPSPKPTQAALL